MSSDVPGSPAGVAGLSTAIGDLRDEAEALRGDVHAAERARRNMALVNLGVLVALLLLVGVSLFLTAQNNQLAHRVQDTNARIADCTSPAGVCYRDGQARTGQAVGALERAEVYVAECARRFPGGSGPAFDAELEACVVGKLAATAGPASPPPSVPAPSRSPGR